MKEKNLKQNLSKNSKNTIKGFVQIKKADLESFKSRGPLVKVKDIQPKLQNLKRFLKSIIERPRLWTSKVDWKETSKLFSLWFGEVLIEGVMANWSTHKLLGLDFGIGMIIAHGFLIKQLLDLYWRLKRDGESNKLVAKN